MYSLSKEREHLRFAVKLTVASHTQSMEKVNHTQHEQRKYQRKRNNKRIKEIMERLTAST